MACGYKYSKPAEKADFVEHDEEKIPELIDQDTGLNGEINVEHYIRYHDELETIPEENDENPLMTEQEDIDEADTIVMPQRNLMMNHLIQPSMTLPKTQLLSWANRPPLHSSQMTYTSQLRR